VLAFLEATKGASMTHSKSTTCSARPHLSAPSWCYWFAFPRRPPLDQLSLKALRSEANCAVEETAGALEFFRSHKRIGVGSIEKVECLGSRADAKVAASVPDVCPDCVRGEDE
jgi:hypothetical protein